MQYMLIYKHMLQHTWLKNVLLFINMRFVLHIRLYKNMCIRLSMQECQVGATPCSERPLSRSRTSCGAQVPSSQLLLSVRLIHDPPTLVHLIKLRRSDLRLGTVLNSTVGSLASFEAGAASASIRLQLSRGPRHLQFPRARG